MDATRPIIQVNSLRKSYGELEAVKGVSFAVRQGEIFSLLGPNGAGKTTTISMLSCLLAPTAGDATVAGHSVREAPLKVKESIGVVPQEVALYGDLSAQENLMFWGRMYGLSGARLKERAAAGLAFAGLEDRARGKVNTYSGGMKRRLNIAASLLHEPRVLYMDEPTVGIDPQTRRRILDTVKELNAAGLTVLYTTHYMEEAEELSHRIGIIDHGELIALGTREELARMVGEADMLRLDISFNGADRAALPALLAGIEGVTAATVNAAEGSGEGAVLIAASDGEAVLPAAVMALSRAGAHVRRLELQEPNLEAVFLHLTGRGLRE
jgi:ABC-2 type transport system ATP-binding protein